MTSKNLSLIVVSFLLVLPLTCDIGFVQGQVKNDGSMVTQQVSEKVLVKGKVVYTKNLGYYVNGEDPPGDLMVENQNIKVLKKLMKSKKTVTIEGHLTTGADNLFIEKIDGRKYSVKK